MINSTEKQNDRYEDDLALNSSIFERSFNSLKTRWSFIFFESLKVNVCFAIKPVVLNYK